MSDIFITKNACELIQYIKNDSESSLFSELCGLIGVDSEENFVYKKMQNRSKSPESYFIIDPYDYLGFINKYKCLTIFHSHIAGDEKPSDFDIKTSENCCYSFLIYSITTEKFFIYEPEFKDYDVNILTKLKKSI